MKTNTAKKANANVINTALAATKAVAIKKDAIAKALCNAAMQAANDSANVWLKMATAVETALKGCTLDEADKLVTAAKRLAKAEAGTDAKLNSTAQQYLANAHNVWRASRIADGEPGKLKADVAAAAATYREAKASGSGKRVIDASRELLKAAGVIKARAPQAPQAPEVAPKAEEAPKAAPVLKDIGPEARGYVRTLRAALVGVTLNKAANDALRGLALLLKLESPDAE
jgi:hypothetical protein